MSTVTVPKDQSARFPIVWFDEIPEQKSSEYLVKGVIECQTVCVVYGPPGSGKSFWCIDLAAHIATGRTWRGKRVNSGLVVYIAAEAGSSILRRFTAWREVNLGEAYEEAVPLVVMPRAVSLLDPDSVTALILELRQISADAGLPVSLVLIDTLSRSLPGGDENSSQAMTTVINVADQIRDDLGATTLFVHHTGKDTARGPRGHSSLLGAVDTEIMIDDHIATAKKVRDGENGEMFGFDLKVVDMGQDADGDPITTCVVVPTNVTQKEKKTRPLSGAAQVALQSLHEAVEDYGEWMPETSTIPKGVQAITIDRWRTQFRVRYGSDDVSGDAVRKAFQRSREALFKNQLIGVSDPYVWTVNQ